MRIICDVIDGLLVIEVWKDETLIGGWYKNIDFVLSINDIQEMCDMVLEVIEYAE